MRGRRDRTSRWLYTGLAYVCAGLALLGLLVPGLPTTPFVLLAAWAASRGSPRMHAWLRDHPRLGPALADWEEEGAVSTPAKLLAVAFLIASWGVMLWRGIPEGILLFLGALFLVVGGFVVTRPRPTTRGRGRADPEEKR